MGFYRSQVIKMNSTEEVKEVQNYLEKKGIIVSETAIIKAAIKIARRWGGNVVFVCEFKEKGEKK